MSDITINYKGNAIATMDASGTKTLLTDGKYCEDDIEVVYVKPGGGTPNLQAKTNINATTSSQTITADEGYDGLSSVQINALDGQAAQTIHPSTSDQTVASGKYLTGAQTIKGVLLTNLDAGNIKKDVVVKVGDSTDDDCVTSVTGTYEGGGGGVGPQWSEFTATLSASNAQACREMLFPNLAVGEMQIAVQKNPDSSNFVANQLLEITVFRRGTTAYDGSGLRYKTSGQWTFASVANTYDAVISVGATYYVSEEVTLV